MNCRKEPWQRLKVLPDLVLSSFLMAIMHKYVATVFRLQIFFQLEPSLSILSRLICQANITVGNHKQKLAAHSWSSVAFSSVLKPVSFSQV